MVELVVSPMLLKRSVHRIVPNFPKGRSSRSTYKRDTLFVRKRREYWRAADRYLKSFEAARLLPSFALSCACNDRGGDIADLADPGMGGAR